MKHRKTPTTLKPSSKADWIAANDAGPHLAVLPSRTVVKFTIPDTTRLAVSDHLNGDLRETALLLAAHPEGSEGYMGDLVSAALIRGDNSEARIQKAIERGFEMSYELVAYMLEEPKVTAEEVAAGVIPEQDVRMLLEFAERRRSVDAAGNELPIVTLHDWRRFRHEPAGDPGAAAGGANGADAEERIPEPDAGVV